MAKEQFWGPLVVDPRDPVTTCEEVNCWPKHLEIKVKAEFYGLVAFLWTRWQPLEGPPGSN